MTSYDPDAAVQSQLAEQAQAVTGNPAAAGVYGDPAGASKPPEQVDLSAAKAVVVDAEALLARIQALEAQQAAAELAANPPAEPPDPTPRLSNASGELQAAFAGLHARLVLIEGKLGL